MHTSYFSAAMESLASFDFCQNFSLLEKLPVFASLLFIKSSKATLCSSIWSFDSDSIPFGYDSLDWYFFKILKLLQNYVMIPIKELSYDENQNSFLVLNWTYLIIIRHSNNSIVGFRSNPVWLLGGNRCCKWSFRILEQIKSVSLH